MGTHSQYGHVQLHALKDTSPVGTNCQHKGCGEGTDGMKITLFLKPLHQTVVPGEPRPHSFEVFHTHLAAPAVSHINCSFTATPERPKLMRNEQTRRCHTSVTQCSGDVPPPAEDRTGLCRSPLLQDCHPLPPALPAHHERPHEPGLDSSSL